MDTQTCRSIYIIDITYKCDTCIYIKFRKQAMQYKAICSVNLSCAVCACNLKNKFAA